MMPRVEEIMIGDTKVSILQQPVEDLPIRERNFKGSIGLAVSPLKSCMNINR